MAKFILRRFLYALLLLLIASILIFYGLRVAPGDVTGSIVSVTGGQQLVSEVRERLGLNEPLATQYFIFIKNVVTGDPGSSLVSGAKITDLIKDAGEKTLKLGLAALVIVYALAIPLGLIAAWGRNRPFDQGARFVAVLGMGIPNFFLAVLLIQLFSVKLGWLPPAGPGGLQPSRAAGRRARDGVDGREHAPDALLDPGGALEGLRPNAEREGPVLEADPLGPRAPQRGRAGDRARRRDDPARPRLHADRRGDLPLRGPRVPVRRLDHES